MLNKFIGVGRLTAAPEMRYTPNGKAIAQFTIALDRPYTKDKEREADFIPVVVWDKQAEACANYLQKGSLIAVEGRVQVCSYENKEGRKVYVTEIIAEGVKFLEGKKDKQQQEKPQPAAVPFKADSQPFTLDTDRLPF